MNERQITPVTHQSNVPAGINFFDPTTIETLNRFSTMFANSSLVPESYRIGGVVGGKTGEGPKKTVSEAEAVANCVIAFDVATRIGASPLMVMQNLYIVYGRPSWSSKFLIATINTCGRFEPLKFELTSNGVCNNGVANVKCVAWTTPKGVTHDENGKPVTSKSPLALRGTAVTIQMAIDEGWYSKNGSKWRTMPEQRLDRWHGEGTSNTQPLLNSKHSINYLNSDYYIESGNFFRIRNVQLAYAFDKSLLAKIRLQALKVYVNIQNLKTWKHNTGYTPELGGTATAFGVDNGSYPVPAVYTFGINLTF